MFMFKKSETNPCEQNQKLEKEYEAKACYKFFKKCLNEKKIYNTSFEGGGEEMDNSGYCYGILKNCITKGGTNQ